MRSTRASSTRASGGRTTRPASIRPAGCSARRSAAPAAASTRWASSRWYMRGGGRELYVEYYQKMLKADVMPFLYAPDGPECFGWFKKPITSVAEFTKLRFRISSGLPSDVLKDMGGVPMNLPGQELIPAAERGIIDGVEWINPANDLPLGLHDVFKFYSIQGLHQAIDIADVMFNGAKWRSLPAGSAGDRRDRAHRVAVRRDALLRARERQGAEGDQGEGRDDVRCAGRLRAGVHQVGEEGAGATSRRRTRSSRRCSNRSAPSRTSWCRTRARRRSSRR